MGIIVALLATAGHKEWTSASAARFHGLGKHEIAWWIILSCHAAMALGTMAGGWRIVIAWIVTFPGAALIGAAGYFLAHLGIQPFIH